MAIIKNNLSMMMKGKVGAYSYYVADTRQIVRQAQNNSNYGATATRTVKQQERRVTWANLVNFYSANRAWMKKAYENLKPGVSVYNRFIQLNINDNKIALTKDEAQSKIWVVAPYRVSQGSLPTMTTGSTPLESGQLPSEIENKNLGDFSRVLIKNYSEFQNGDAIAFVTFSGTTAAPISKGSHKRASYNYNELVLNTASTAPLPSWIVYLEAANSYFIDMEQKDAADAFVLIHTRSVGGQLLVSTESMLVNKQPDDGWRGEAQQGSAIESYGQFDLIPLEPGGSTSSGTGNDSSSGGSGDDDDDDGNIGA